MKKILMILKWFVIILFLANALFMLLLYQSGHKIPEDTRLITIRYILVCSFLYFVILFFEKRNRK
jgi:hypothetical protein